MNNSTVLRSPPIFISYSHDSDSHKQRVLALADRLRGDGLNVMLDRYLLAPPEGWPRWMDQQIRRTEFVLLICTATYRCRVEGEEESGTGRGSLWEGHLMYQHLYNARAVNLKFIPVLLAGSDISDIPLPLQSVPSYRADTQAGYEELYRRITNQPSVVKPELGEVRAIPSQDRPGSDPQIGAAHQRHQLVRPLSRPAALAGLVAAVVLALGLYAWRVHLVGEKPAVYRVRVTVLDPQDVPVNDASVTSSLGGEPMKVDGGWLFVIPAESRARDGKLTVYADLPKAFLRGSKTELLGTDQSVEMRVRLEPRPAAWVRGTVRDVNSHAISDVRVSVDGYGQEAVTTGVDGSFVLPAHKAEGQDVLLHAAKPGYRAVLLGCQAGERPVELILQR